MLTISSDGARGETSGAIPLRLRPAVLEALLAQLDTGVLVLDADGRVAYENEAARRLRDDRDLLTGRRSGPVTWASDLATARALLAGERERDAERRRASSDGEDDGS